MMQADDTEANYQRWRKLLRDFDDRQNPDELRLAKLIASTLNGEGGVQRIEPYDWDRMHWSRRQRFIDAARAVIQELDK